MKNLKSQFIAIIFVAVSAWLVVGCTKQPNFKADPNNPYITGVPNPPTAAGQAIINSVAPSSALPNTVVVIGGNNFNTAVSGNSVTVNGIPATVNEVSSTRIVFTVPLNATTGKIVLISGPNTVTYTSDFVVKSGTVSTFLNLGANNVQHLVFDPAGNLYGDNLTSILKISSGGAISTYPIGVPTGTFGSIWGIAINKNTDELFLPDRVKHTIIKIDGDGKVTTMAGNGIEEYLNGQGSFAHFIAPTGITMDPNGNLYVTDSHRVRKINSSGVVTTLAGSATDGTADGIGAAASFGSLEGITTDAQGNVYVSDTKYLKIRRITPDGVVTTFAGSGTAGFADGPGATAQFSHPASLAFDAAGNLFVADSNPLLPFYAIRMINKLGAVTTFLKGTSNSGVINGPTSTASVSLADGITFDPAGNMYIANTAANIISKVTF
ncbi:IPT/TIG domain-containing protein [Mucilaginibacter sp. UYCu711]|uniref:NHL domain-containing protein n=1 Tax=Mucilaginibacter sp. UYCu711 TaxID=3156339 RepID=UPI003D1F7FBB